MYIYNIASLDGDELCSAQPSLPLSYLSPLSLSLWNVLVSLVLVMVCHFFYS